MSNDRGSYGSNGVSHDLRVQAVARAVQEFGGRYVGVALRQTTAPGPVWITYATTWRPQIDDWISQQLATPGYVYVVAFDRTSPRWDQQGYALVEVSAPPPTTSSGAVVGAQGRGGSSLKWILGVAAVGATALWVRHTSQEIGQLYKSAGLPRSSFGSTVRSDAKRLSSRARETWKRLRGGREPAREIAEPHEETT